MNDHDIRAESDTNDLLSFARLVQAMRAKQTAYFRKGRLPGDLADAKQLEREVDRVIEDTLAGITLFDHHTRRPGP